MAFRPIALLLYRPPDHTESCSPPQHDLRLSIALMSLHALPRSTRCSRLWPGSALVPPESSIRARRRSLHITIRCSTASLQLSAQKQKNWHDAVLFFHKSSPSQTNSTKSHLASALMWIYLTTRRMLARCLSQVIMRLRVQS